MSTAVTRRSLVRSIKKIGQIAVGTAIAGPIGAFELQGRLKPLSIHSLKGDVMVSGSPADQWVLVHSSARIQSGPNAEMIFRVGKCSFLIRDNTDVTFELDGAELKEIILEKGAIYSLFAPKRDNSPVTLSTKQLAVSLTEGAIYLESMAVRTYACLCHGEARLVSVEDGNEELLTSVRHDTARFVYTSHTKDSLIRKSRPKLHSDRELGLLYQVQGRLPMFGNFLGLQSRVRRKL